MIEIDFIEISTNFAGQNIINISCNFYNIMNWIYLIVGGLFEAIFAFSLERLSESTGRAAMLWFFSFLVSVSISMFLLSEFCFN